VLEIANFRERLGSYWIWPRCTSGHAVGIVGFPKRLSRGTRCYLFALSAPNSGENPLATYSSTLQGGLELRDDLALIGLQLTV